MKTNGKRWKMACWLVGIVVGLQFYFVQELIAAFAFFVIGFAAIAVVIASLYVLQKGWEAAVTRLIDSRHFSGRGLQSRSPAQDTL